MICHVAEIPRMVLRSGVCASRMPGLYWPPNLILRLARARSSLDQVEYTSYAGCDLILLSLALSKRAGE